MALKFKPKRSAIRSNNIVGGAGSLILGASMNRRSSFPAVKVPNRASKNSNSSLPASVNTNVHHHKQQQQHLSHNHNQNTRGRSFDLSSLKIISANKNFANHFGSKYRKTNDSFYHSNDHHQQILMFADFPVLNNLSYNPLLPNLDKDRRRSVPQDIFIRSLDNYPA